MLRVHGVGSIIIHLLNTTIRTSNASNVAAFARKHVHTISSCFRSFNATARFPDGHRETTSRRIAIDDDTCVQLRLGHSRHVYRCRRRRLDGDYCEKLSRGDVSSTIPRMIRLGISGRTRHVYRHVVFVPAHVYMRFAHTVYDTLAPAFSRPDDLRLGVTVLDIKARWRRIDY